MVVLPWPAIYIATLTTQNLHTWTRAHVGKVSRVSDGVCVWAGGEPVLLWQGGGVVYGGHGAEGYVWPRILQKFSALHFKIRPSTHISLLAWSL